MVIVAGVGAYVSLSSKPKSTSSTTTHSSSSTGQKTTSSYSLSSQGTAVNTYSGSFNYSIPTGPSGVRSLSNGTAQYYNSTEEASGTFSFFISSLNESGSGSGKGTLTIVTKGFCTATYMLPYTFKVPDATLILKGNLTVFFSSEAPVNYTVPLTCTGPMAGASQVNNPWSYLPEYPGEFSVATVPVSVVQHTGDFTWGFSVEETST